MRLIDADALKSVMIETLESLKRNPKMDLQEFHLICAFHTVGMMVDNAPTVDIDWTKHETTTGSSKSVSVNPAYPLGTGNPAYPLGGGGNYQCSNTVDAVQVVRCGDCIYYLDGGCGNISEKSPAQNLLDVSPNWYCADGEKSEDADD